MLNQAFSLSLHDQNGEKYKRNQSSCRNPKLEQGISLTGSWDFSDCIMSPKNSKFDREWAGSQQLVSHCTKHFGRAGSGETPAAKFGWIRVDQPGAMSSYLPDKIDLNIF